MNLFGKKLPEPHPQDDPRYPVRKTEAEWRAQLDAMQFQVARKAATRRLLSTTRRAAWIVVALRLSSRTRATRRRARDARHAFDIRVACRR